MIAVSCLWLFRLCLLSQHLCFTGTISKLALGRICAVFSSVADLKRGLWVKLCHDCLSVVCTSSGEDRDSNVFAGQPGEELVSSGSLQNCGLALRFGNNKGVAFTRRWESCADQSGVQIQRHVKATLRSLSEQGEKKRFWKAEPARWRQFLQRHAVLVWSVVLICLWLDFVLHTLFDRPTVGAVWRAAVCGITEISLSINIKISITIRTSISPNISIEMCISTSTAFVFTFVFAGFTHDQCVDVNMFARAHTNNSFLELTRC